LHIQQTGDDVSEDTATKDWSGRYLRLRAEVIVLSLLMVTITRMDLTLTKLPLLGVELSKAPPVSVIASVMILFFFYILIGWVLRYRVERAEALMPVRSVQSFLGEITDQLKAVEKMTPPDAAALKRGAVRVESALSHYMSVIDGDVRPAVQKLEASLVRLEELGSSLRSHIAVGDQEFDRWQNKLDEAKEVVARAPAIPTALVERLRETVDALSLEREKIEDELKGKSDRINETKEKFRTAITELRSELQSRSRAFFWEREVWGFWLPIIFVAVSVVVWLPQAIYDVAQLFSGLAECVSSLDGQCLFFRGSHPTDTRPLAMKPFLINVGFSMPSSN